MIANLPTYLVELTSLYQDYLGIIGIGFVVALLLTPITGAIAFRLNALDHPTEQRDRNDKTRDRRIHNESTPLLGGVAVMIAFVIGVLAAVGTGLISLNSQQLVFLGLGLAVVIILGVADSVTDVSPKYQLLLQILAALLPILGGIKIELIEILNISIDLSQPAFSIPIEQYTLQINPLADVFTLIWIVAIVNAINWVSGIDGLAGFISLIAALTLMFLGVRFEAVLAATLAASLAGAVLGFLPFNFPPARTFNGTVGDMGQGYLLAILAIISGAKLSVSLIILALPLIDAIWVLGGRFLRHRHEFKSPLDILHINDKTHLHHRLLELGLGVRQVLFLEIGVFFAFCMVAYYLADFRDELLYLIAAVVVIIALFSLLNIAQVVHNRRKAERDELEVPEKKAVVSEESQTPEERYAY